METLKNHFISGSLISLFGKTLPVNLAILDGFPHEQLHYFEEEDDILFVVVTEGARLSFCLLAKSNLPTWLSKFALKMGWV
jgi:hypothetical protein